MTSKRHAPSRRPSLESAIGRSRRILVAALAAALSLSVMTVPGASRSAAAAVRFERPAIAESTSGSNAAIVMPGAVSTAVTTATRLASKALTATPLKPAAPSVRWALIGNDGTHLASEKTAGLTTKVFELGWSSYEPANGAFDSAYITAKRAEAAKLRSAGFTLILSFGVQYAPGWLLNLPNARYVNQYGTAYVDTSPGSGEANFVWNDELRSLQARYIARVFADLGTNWAAVRIGGGRYGELGYPVATYGGQANTYWAFDANAARSNPVPGWKPGMASPTGEARAFADWYMSRLAGYASWQAKTVRKSFAGRLMVLFPSFGVRPGQLDLAIGGNLSGATSAEKNGELQRGYDVARQVGTLVGQSAIVLTTTWLDCPYGSDSSSSQVDWRPVHYLAYLASLHGMALYGENTGAGSSSVLSFTVSQARTYGLLGLAWFNEHELMSGTYATLTDLSAVIQAN